MTKDTDPNLLLGGVSKRKSIVAWKTLLKFILGLILAWLKTFFNKVKMAYF